jgi:HPt (histidine-containing phosphotransfer) domain-containing protein
MLEPMLHAADLSEAARTLHTFKGLSLTVGAVHLGESCRAGELEIKAALGASSGLEASGLGRIGARIAESVTATARTLETELTGLVPKPDSLDQTVGNGSGQSGTTDLIADLRHLESLLVQSDMRAIDAHKELWRVHGASAQGRLDALNAALLAFDFGRGVVQCGELIREFSAF